MVRTVFSPLETINLATQVERSLEHAIFTGKLKPGERLIEVELAEAMQVSRASLREALRLLETKGLIVTSPRRGAYVIDLTDTDVREIYRVRLLLEDFAIRQATATKSAELVEALDRLIAAMRDRAGDRDYFAIVDLDMEFHRQICSAAGNSRLLTMWNALVAPTRALLLTKYRLFDDSDEITNGHVVLLSAIRDGDADLAATLLDRHITDTHEAIIEYLGRERDRPEDAAGGKEEPGADE